MVEIITWCVLAVAMEAGWDYQVVCVRLRLYRASQTKQQVQRCNGELSKHRSFTKIIPDSGTGTRNERKKKQLGYDDAGTKHETLVKPRCTLLFCLHTVCTNFETQFVFLFFWGCYIHCIYTDKITTIIFLILTVCRSWYNWTYIPKCCTFVNESWFHGWLYSFGAALGKNSNESCKIFCFCLWHGLLTLWF